LEQFHKNIGVLGGSPDNEVVLEHELELNL